MWKVIVSPTENADAWRDFVQQGIVAIGWGDRCNDNVLPVRRFMREMQKDDWVVAHLSGNRGGATFLAVGVGQIIGEYAEVHPTDGWNESFRRQFKVRWLSTDRQRMPDLFRTCNYRITVCSLSEQVASEVVHRYGLRLDGSRL